VKCIELPVIILPLKRTPPDKYFYTTKIIVSMYSKQIKNKIHKQMPFVPSQWKTQPGYQKKRGERVSD
jgi:hypothetical protein